MKSFTTAGSILMLILFSTSNGFAQADPASRQAAMKQKLITELKLTNVQADSVVAINMDFMPQRREIFQDQSLSPDDKKAKMKAVSDQADKRILPVLGDSLFKQYQDWRIKNMQQMRNGRQGNN